MENLVLNFSMIMMGIFEGVFAALAAGMATAMNTTADALSEAFDKDGEGSAGKKKAGGLIAESEVNEKVKEVFSGLRKEVSEGFSEKDQAFRRFIKDPAFDAGVRIVESHTLNLPRLTEALSDADLAAYMTLIQKEDPEVVSLMKELGEWQQTTPKFRK
jgi:Spy/CpxP family protein refolding chaperone